MFHFRLYVFNSVATHLSFTKAAAELYITQPAVTKNIKELESTLGINLFTRTKNGISLTKAGDLLKAYTKRLIEQEKILEYELSELKGSLSGILQLGASTTIGQYILPVILEKFNRENPNIKISLLNENTYGIEKEVLSKEIDLGIVEGSSKFKELKYIPFMQDEIVAIAHSSQAISKTTNLTLDELKKTPLVLRETGSGSLDVIADKLNEHGIKFKDMNIRMHLGSTESIKTFLRNSNSIGFVSIHAISHEKSQDEFKIIPINELKINRVFNFIYPQGQLGGLVEKFMTFVKKNYNL